MKIQFLPILFATFFYHTSYAVGACQYELDSAKTELKWTGYKTPKKVGVSGKFKKINISGQKVASTPLEAIENLNFSIDVTSLFSGDEARDVKISKILLMGTDKISGKLKSKSETELIFDTTLNSTTKSITLKAEIKGNKIIAHGYMDVLDFMLNKNLSNFAAACQEKHEGKTWSDVFIDLKLSFNKSCK